VQWITKQAMDSRIAVPKRDLAHINGNACSWRTQTSGVGDNDFGF